MRYINDFLRVPNLLHEQLAAGTRRFTGQQPCRRALLARPLDGGLYAYVRLDAHGRRCRDGGRVVNVATVTAIGVNAAGRREVLGCGDVITGEDGAGWTAFPRDLVNGD